MISRLLSVLIDALHSAILDVCFVDASPAVAFVSYLKATRPGGGALLIGSDIEIVQGLRKCINKGGSFAAVVGSVSPCLARRPASGWGTA